MYKCVSGLLELDRSIDRLESKIFFSFFLGQRHSQPACGTKIFSFLDNDTTIRQLGREGYEGRPKGHTDFCLRPKTVPTGCCQHPRTQKVEEKERKGRKKKILRRQREIHRQERNQTSHQLIVTVQRFVAIILLHGYCSHWSVPKNETNTKRNH